MLFGKLQREGFFHIRRLSLQDIKKVVLITIVGLSIIPLFIGSFVSIIFSQDASGFRLWWLGFSQKGIKATLIGEVLAAGVASIMRLLRSDTKNRDEKNRVESDVAIYGDAHFMTTEEIRNTYTISDCAHANRFIYGTIDEARKYVISQRRYGAHERPDNNNILLMAAAGSGKSAGVLSTMIMQMARSGENMFITDPKGELYAMMARYLEKMGYDVFVFATKKEVMPYSDRFNPMDFLDQDINKVLSFATAILELSEEKIDYFENGELALFVALCCYLTNKDLSHEEGVATIPYMYHMLATIPAERISECLKTLPQGAPGYEASRVFINAKERHGDFISGLVGKLQKYSSHDATVMLSQTDFEPLDFMENRAVLFLVMDDHDSTFEPLTRCFFNQFVNAISELADRYPGNPDRGYKARKIYPAFNMILEETNNIGKINSLDRLISTVRGRNMNTVLTFQNIEQMKDTYQDKRESLISACHTQIFFGVNDNATAEYVAKWLGTKTVQTELTSRNESNIKPIDIILTEQHRFSDVQAPLLTPEQVKQESRTKLLIQTFGRSPMMLYPYMYWDHDDGDKLEDESIYIRCVRRKRSEVFYEKFGIPYKDEKERYNRKQELRKRIHTDDIDKYYEERLGTKLVEQAGIKVDRPEPVINPDAAPLDRNPSIKPANRPRRGPKVQPVANIPAPAAAKHPTPKPAPTGDPKPTEKQQEHPTGTSRPLVSAPKKIGGTGAPKKVNSPDKDML